MKKIRQSILHQLDTDKMCNLNMFEQKILAQKMMFFHIKIWHKFFTLINVLSRKTLL